MKIEKSKKEINSLKKNLDKVSQKEKELLKELRLLETKERKLKSSLAKEKTRLLEVVKQAYIAGHSPRIGLDQNGEITSYYLAKIAAQRSEKIKKYSDVEVQDFLLNNIRLNLTSTPDLHGIHAKLGLKNLKDLNSIDSLNKARLGIKYLFDNLDFNDFFTYLYRSVMGPARMAGFDVKQPIKNIKLLTITLRFKLIQFQLKVFLNP